MNKPGRPPIYADEADESQHIPPDQMKQRQQAAKVLEEMLGKQMESELERQPQLKLLHADSFKRAEELAFGHKDRALRKFLRDKSEILVKHWMEFFNRKYPRPGRPRGTGHQKVKVAELLASIGLGDIGQLRKAGMSDRDLKTLYAYIRTKSQKGAAKELGITPQAVNKRINQRISPALRQINPHFSTNQLRSAIAERSQE